MNKIPPKVKVRPRKFTKAYFFFLCDPFSAHPNLTVIVVK